jgi:hypothetical protein
VNSPTQCIFWEKPELALHPVRQGFELLETYEEESHWWRYLLKCRECGQKYFFEFYEEIDWDEGKDPQYCTYIPVETSEEVEALRQTSPFELVKFSPRLQVDFPKGAKERIVRWMTESAI